MPNAFELAVNATPHVAGQCRPGLQALGGHSTHVTPAQTNRCEGSLDIDSALRNAMPNDSRWDYALCYDGQVTFVEVHPAASGANYDEVFKKARWLQQWLLAHASAINALPKRAPAFVWISTGRTQRPTATQARILAQAGVTLLSRLRLP